MDFSVVIPSRNRASLLRSAIESVVAQNHDSFEVIVVNDGTEGEQAIAYSDMEKMWPDKVFFINLEFTPNGHGPSFSINRGVERAVGEYVCFLDDDDSWTDPDHLARAWLSLREDSADVYISKQEAFLNDVPVKETLWLNGFHETIRKIREPDANGMFKVCPDELLRFCGGKFAHLNTLVTRKSLYMSVGEMDEHIRYECEWDLYLRLCGAAKSIIYSPRFVARHNVPDSSKAVNVSTAMSFLRKMLFRANVLDKALMFNELPEIRKMAERHKIFTLKKIVEFLVDEKKYSQALFYAREAKIKPFDFKWHAYVHYLFIRSLLSNISKESA